MNLLVKIGFMPITFWDLLDILIVGYLLFQVYKLLKGSLAFNIFAGIILVYIGWWLVDILNMGLLSVILNQFVSVGVILLLIVFQPEVRRFLLFLGQNTLKRRPGFFKQLFNREETRDTQEQERLINKILKAVERMAKAKTGALMLFTDNPNVEGYSESGVLIDAQLSTRLIESIFNKESPLHDGAMIIKQRKIHAASCILPVSDSPEIPEEAGLRHRAAVGATEGTDVVAVVVSEERGHISIARQGKLTPNISRDQLHKYLRKIIK